MSLRVLVVDDERNIRSTLRLCLEGLGCRVTEASSADAALQAVAAQPFELAFVDLRLGQESGLELVPRLIAELPLLDVIVITAFATIDTAVEAIRRGARDYLPKPFTPAQIDHLVSKTADRRLLTERVGTLERTLSEEVPEVDLDTRSPAMRGAIALVSRAAASDAPVLLRGESGTGKGVLARTLHLASPRRARPFVTVNCPTLSNELLTSELFGHARGAFTGAVRDQEGKVEAAEGGTLFLDEIAELSPPLQAKLLRFVQEKRFERIGETRTRHADVRVVAATNRDLEADVKEGRFREDLLYRLNVIEVQVPPLRERVDDILPLARRFLQFFSRASRRAVPELSKAAEDALRAYTWPGNVRELRNAMERAVIIWPAPVIEPDALPGKVAVAQSAAPGARPGSDLTLEQLEQAHIEAVVARSATLEEAARVLGIDPSTLYRRRRRQEK
jgi:NtrC-family two-component system response regulator AlgB